MMRKLRESKNVYKPNEKLSVFQRGVSYVFVLYAVLSLVSARPILAATPLAITGVKEWLHQELLNAEKIYPIESGSTIVRLHQAQSLTEKFNPYQVVLEISNPKENQQEFYKVPIPFKMIHTVSVRDGSILIFGRIQSENDFQMSDRIVKIRYRDPDTNKLASSITSQDVTNQGVKVGSNELRD